MHKNNRVVQQENRDHSTEAQPSTGVPAPLNESPVGGLRCEGTPETKEPALQESRTDPLFSERMNNAILLECSNCSRPPPRSERCRMT